MLVVPASLNLSWPIQDQIGLVDDHLQYHSITDRYNQILPGISRVILLVDLNLFKFCSSHIHHIALLCFAYIPTTEDPCFHMLSTKKLPSFRNRFR